MLSIKHTRKKDVGILRTDVTDIFANTHAPQVLCKAICTKAHCKIKLMHLVQMLPSVIYACKLTYVCKLTKYVALKMFKRRIVS